MSINLLPWRQKQLIKRRKHLLIGFLVNISIAVIILLCMQQLLVTQTLKMQKTLPGKTTTQTFIQTHKAFIETQHELKNFALYTKHMHSAHKKISEKMMLLTTITNSLPINVALSKIELNAHKISLFGFSSAQTGVYAFQKKLASTLFDTQLALKSITTNSDQFVFLIQGKK